LTSLPDRLSGGEQQRVAIARSLVRGPSLILADEPTGALDLDTGQTVMELIDDVATRTGAALVIITHDPAIATRARDHYRLDRGVLRRADAGVGERAAALAAGGGGA
jgi:putative ABC transport system ATP-binding protein